MTFLFPMTIAQTAISPFEGPLEQLQEIDPFHFGGKKALGHRPKIEPEAQTKSAL